MVMGRAMSTPGVNTYLFYFSFFISFDNYIHCFCTLDYTKCKAGVRLRAGSLTDFNNSIF